MSQAPGPLVIGIDGGGTKTLARAYTREGECLAEVRSGALDLPTLGAAECRLRLSRIRDELAAKLPSSPGVYQTVLGAPGYGEVQQWTDAWHEITASTLGPWRPTVHNDVRLAFYAAFPEGVGILVLAGTGSMAWGGNGTTEARTGGWGQWFGDEGSAFYLGRKALQAAASALDGRGPKTVLTEVIPAATGARSLWDATEALLKEPGSYRTNVATIAQVVDSAAASGDAVSEELIEDAARHLALHAVALHSELGQVDVRVAYAGGVFNSGRVVKSFNEQLRAAGLPAAEPTAALPVTGAVFLARREPSPSR